MAAQRSPAVSQPRALVHGAGPTGAVAALALADAGWAVTIHDPLSSSLLLGRSRAYAFNHSSQRLLARIGLWDDLTSCMVPFRQLELRDEPLMRAVPFGSADLSPRSRRAGLGAVGWIAEHGPLMTSLLRRLAEHPAIELHLGEICPGGSGSPSSHPEAHLIVAADGPSSPHRQALGIGLWHWPYHQSCVTAQVELRGSADDQAWELFRPEGPFAVLPLGGRRFQLVWSASSRRCSQLEALPPVAFLDAVSAALPDQLQPDALLDQPRAFPVALSLARRLRHGKTVLLGESAHRCHPVGGQGLNLCWRDVADLHRLALQVVAGRLRPGQLPARYGRQRWPDLVLTVLVTDVLVRLFSNRLPLLLCLRRLGLSLLFRSAALRRLSLGVMTEGPCRPWSLAPASANWRPWS